VRVIRAIYLREARKDNSLPGDPTKLPSAAVTMRREKWQRQTTKDKPGLAFADFPAWLAAWRKLEPLRRAYHLTALLTGARPGELARTPLDNVDAKAYTLTIGNSKAGNDIPIPLSPMIERALEMAAKARPKRNKDNLIFAGCEQAGHRDKLPARGHALRRTYKTVAFDCGVPDDLSAFLLGHIPEGMSAKYALRRMLLDGPMLRERQAEISARMVHLFGSDPTLGMAPRSERGRKSVKARKWKSCSEDSGDKGLASSNL
jgi:integrase